MMPLSGTNVVDGTRAERNRQFADELKNSGRYAVVRDEAVALEPASWSAGSSEGPEALTGEELGLDCRCRTGRTCCGVPVF